MVDADLNPQVVAQVREAIDMVEVVGDHVRLKKQGRRWQGLCPFHEEKTPSFSVDPEKGLYYCFGCHAGGDAINFMMQLENLGFPEAVERLARRFGVRLPARTPEARQRRQEGDRIRSLLEEAQHWFGRRLEGADGAAARAELERRGFAKESWADFGFGFAPDAWRELITELARRHPEGAIVGAGLAVTPEEGRSPYDRFRNRITFPIRGSDGRLIAFGGRILGQGEPKYLNSPESAIFSKRHTLFCLDRARRAVTDSGEVLVVEGYFDCLSLHRVGITRTVATLGTALTADHARILRRLLGADGRVLLCYDADEAGRRAAGTGAQVLLEAGVNAAVVVIEGGKDPDDVIREGGIEAMQRLLDQPVELLDFLLHGLPEESGARRKAGLKLAPLVCAARDPAVRQNLVEELARRLYLRPGEVEEQGRAPRRRGDERPTTTSKAAEPPGERHLACILLECSAEWRRKIVELVEPEGLQSPQVRCLLLAAAELVASDDEAVDLTTSMMASDLDDVMAAYMAELANTEMPEVTEETIKSQLTVLVDRQARERARRMGPLIEAAEGRGDIDEVNRLLTEKARLRQNSPKF